MPKRSKRFVFVPFCGLSQAFQAQGIAKNWKSSINPIVEKLLEKEINIIQLPCPEASFGGYKQGLCRVPKGLKHYNTEQFITHCDLLANGLIEMIEGILHNGYEISAILGVEHSPSCASSFIYTNKGMESRKGIFMDCLFNQLHAKQIDIPFIGINRRSLAKCMRNLDSL